MLAGRWMVRVSSALLTKFNTSSGLFTDGRMAKPSLPNDPSRPLEGRRFNPGHAHENLRHHQSATNAVCTLRLTVGPRPAKPGRSLPSLLSEAKTLRAVVGSFLPRGTSDVDALNARRYAQEMGTHPDRRGEVKYAAGLSSGARKAKRRMATSCRPMRLTAILVTRQAGPV